MLQPEEFFEIEDSISARLFDGCHFVWEVLNHLEEHVKALTGDKSVIEGEVMPGAYVSSRPVYISPTAVVQPGAYILGPAYIGPEAVVRHGAFIRENVIMLKGAVLGHASEAKNSLFMAKAQAPHFNYVGDSVLGQHTNLGAGTKLSNLSILSEKDRTSGRRPTIKISINGEVFDTGREKLGAILGDGVQTGCNAVLNPGCLVGPHSLIYPNLNLRKGLYPGGAILKLRQKINIDNRDFHG